MYNPGLMDTTNTFDLVIFDCDGVLVDTEPLANQVYVQMLGELGFHVDTQSYLQEFYGVALPKRPEATSQKLNWIPPQDFIPVFHERLSALTVKHVQPVAGIHALIESLNVPICVASNGSRAEIVLRLKVARLTTHFGAAIFSALEVPHPKPAPDVFLAAAQSFNVAPARCIVIEDSILGVTAAVRAGMRVYGHAAYMSRDALQKAGAIPFGTMAELQQILNRLNL